MSLPRVLCARFPHLALVVAWRGHPELRSEPVIVGGAPELRLPVLAASAAARASGVHPGQPLREAQQRCPEAAFVAADEVSVAHLREELLSRLNRLAPVVEVGDEVAWCDLTGRHAAHPDSTGWAVAVARCIQELLDDDDVAVGVASSRQVAEIAARQAGPHHIRRVAPGEEAAFLAPLPLSVLPLDPAVAARLAALGLDCVGAVANLSAADLQRQFGPVGMDLWHQARGGDGRGEWSPGHGLGIPDPPRRLGERILLEGGTGDLEALRFAVHRSALDLGDRLRHHGCRAAAVILVCELEDAEPSGLRITPLQQPGSGAELWPVALELLAGMALTAPVTAVRLEVEGLRPGAGRQVDLWRGGDAAGEEIGGVASRLRARFGQTAVRRAELTVDPGDLPERRFRWIDPVAADAGGEGRGARAAGVATELTAAGGASEGSRGRTSEHRQVTAASGVPAAVMPLLRR